MDQKLKNTTKLTYLRRIYQKIITLNYLPRWIILCFDVFISIISLTIALYFTSKLFPESLNDSKLPLVWTAVAILFGQIIFFKVFQIYSSVLRFSNHIDLAKILLAVVGNVVVLLMTNVLVLFLFGYYLFSNNVLFIFAVCALLLLILFRLLVRTTYDFLIQIKKGSIPVMIYGTREAAVGIARALYSDPDSTYRLVGFIEDSENINSIQKEIMGYRVYLLNEENVKNEISKRVKTVIVSPLKMQVIDPKKDLDIFFENHITVLTSPHFETWGEDKSLSVKQLKTIQIEDLLERAQIEISTENIRKQLNGKVVLVSGAAGSIGSEIVFQVAKYKPALIVLLDQAESPLHDLKLELEKKYPNLIFKFFLGDVRNKTRMEFMMNLYKPDFVYHAAAYKHVPLMEDNPMESILTNVQGTKVLADLAVKYKVVDFVLISTDKAVNPTNVMGASKRIAEIYVQSLARKMERENNTITRFITTRFGNVLGSNGSVIPYFRKQIEAGGPVTVTHPEIIRYFMTVPEACMLVLEAGAMGQGGEIFIFDMGEPVKIVDLARKMIRLSGLKPNEDIKIEFTGLRPGEKLYEELLNHKETTLPTHHPKIMVAKVQEYCYDKASEMIDELICYASQCKDFLVVTQMKKIVPEFISNNSPYEALDIGDLPPPENK